MIPDWPRALGGPAGQAQLKFNNDDFIVEELFEFEPSDDGEFDWLWIEKSGDSTDYVARAIAREAGVTTKAVTYSGLKDRHALTRQWFCVHRAGKPALEWQDKISGNWRVLKACRHRQKLRRGSHRGNHFTLSLRDFVGDKTLLEARADAVAQGFPNYFGEQRFGRDGGNITACRDWFGSAKQLGRFEKSMYLSSARAWLFNQLLAARVDADSWCSPLDGELFALRDSGSIFSEPLNADIFSRLELGDIHPTGPLFGAAGKTCVMADVAELEAQIFGSEPELCDGLLRSGLKMERRSLRVLAKNMHWHWADDQTFCPSFSLPRGCFATALVRELIEY